ncbi:MULTISPECIES: UDP-N-acetylmuramoyl-L-alanine--D-glutamate ligase [unclassified Minwuia]|jgi:UDP-N-acetylmuramoylalanine--D-glutamate ligase|uniref:UDP-N-acetylmuramoyl-L-alanine--D-glutamate ligase n=1 Tax=unclassified Minwuia TaxID=2618799 RepID=UPI00247899DD|nr:MULTISPECIES: UDP-N-acetylmuramoyl-L-alanine--D-glutamate ligase [unclassified Minwuia]
MIPLTICKDKTLFVLGLARSGRAVVAAALAGGARVLAWDDTADARARVSSVEMVAPDKAGWSAIDMLVLAPGIPLTHPKPHPAVVAATDAGVEVIGDVELFVRQMPDARIVAVTGTNGKSTTTAMIGHVLQSAGLDAAIAGNIGVPVLELAPGTPDRVHVLELSSYQIDLTPSIRPEVGILLNITPDHLDRHGGMAGYVNAKRKLFARMDSGCTAVIGIDDRYGRDLVDTLSQVQGLKICPIAVGRPRPGSVYVLEGRAFADGLSIIDLNGHPTLPGKHNHQNVAAAIAACQALGLGAAKIAAGIGSFPGLPHRIERLGERGGVSFYNDSKATNPEAAARALASFERIYWIAGGVPKDGPLAPVLPFLDRVARTYLIGAAEARFAVELSGRTDCVPSGTLARAVAQATSDAEAAGGGVVLLSPACASFDQFTDFEARGDAFRALVADLLSAEVVS